MLIKMAKEKQPKPKKKVEVPQTHKEEKHSYFPRLLIVYSLIVIVIALNHFFNWYSFPSYVTTVILLISGLWMLKIGVAKGFYGRRKEIFKKYI